MKVSTIQEEAKFKPVTLSITFESEEELRVFQQMTNHDYTIPDLLLKRGDISKKDSEVLRRVLIHISDELDKLED